MDQMADEMMLTTDVKDEGIVHAAEESSTWVRGERTQNEAKVSSWRIGISEETEPGETSRDDDDAQQPKECDNSHSPLFSLKMYLRRSFSAASSTTDSLSPSQQSIDCAGIVLNCLFCRFYDMMLMLPASCERVANHCCPNYKQVMTTPEATLSSNDDPCADLDCGLFNSCHDAGDCLELAMEISELCYH
ncbi:myoD family inhibitor domain-containing protein 2 [Cheilinus undulatus]|uniref:myoD family inhibitor domain-containing protein 2 n=1 Tax=Cheilinus undulatus TaxID=241271 RepID=UPI001BD20B57|nr:myoD family inhibitor domain-containing protein 2 [Cheilinus undulatus]